MSDEWGMPNQETELQSQAADAEQMPTSGARVIRHLSHRERVDLGKAARKSCPRSAHAAWDPPDDRPDPIGLLEDQEKTRVPELVPIRHTRMMVSPFAFYRGAAVIMASDLSTMPSTGLYVQLCGDAHLSNFGGFASPERALVFDVNDFDETLPGPWEWDVKRLVASVEIAGRERGFDAKFRRRLVQETMAEYQRSMHEFAVMGNLELWYLHLDLAELRRRWGSDLEAKAMKEIEKNVARASRKDSHRAFEKFTRRVDGQIRIAANPPLIIPVEDLETDLEQEQIIELMREYIRRYRSSLRGDYRYLLENYRYTHLARKVVGVGSVGTHTWILLLLGHDEEDALFLQVKEAQASVLEPYLGKSVYANHGRRVVEGQWLMQATSDVFLGWDRVKGLGDVIRDLYVRQLWDWKISPDIEAMSPERMLVYGRMCAWTLARAHARSGDRVAISTYLGKSDRIHTSMAEFAVAYADQNERDYQELVAAVKSGRVKVEQES